MAMPFKYPWRVPYGAWLFTTGGLLVVLLPGSVWVERQWGWSLPPYGVETIVAISCIIGLIAAAIAFQRQSPPEPGAWDEPD